MLPVLQVLLATTVGTVFSCLLSILPSLHAYNLLGLLAMGYYELVAHGSSIPPEVYLPFTAGVVVGWSILNTIPSVLLGTPDESAIFVVLPGQKYLMLGRGYEGTMLTGVGGLFGILFTVLILGPLAPAVFPFMQQVLRLHMHWILWVVITFIVMSEWPKGGNTGVAGWRKFFSAWRSLGAGLATFVLSGILGFILLYRSPVSADVAFQNIMPAFVGLFALPWCVLNIASSASMPKQHITSSLNVNADLLLRGTVAGGLGGGFAAFFPVITGGIGGMLAGHATAQRDERVFILSQGVSKVVYYVGSLLIFFVPGLGISSGGASLMMKTVHRAGTWYDYYMVLGAIALSGAISFLLMGPLTRLTIRFIEHFHYKRASMIALVIIVTLVYLVTNWVGLAIMLVAGGIGSIPVLFASRRLNCLGIILLPIACNMSGFGHKIAAWMGLI